MPERTNAQNNYRVTAEVLFLKGNVNKTLEEWKDGRRNHFRVRKSIIQGEYVLTPLTSVVLNGNHMI
jgi:uncharacterized protein YhfF